MEKTRKVWFSLERYLPLTLGRKHNCVYHLTLTLNMRKYELSGEIGLKPCQHLQNDSRWLMIQTPNRTLKNSNKAKCIVCAWTENTCRAITDVYLPNNSWCSTVCVLCIYRTILTLALQSWGYNFGHQPTQHLSWGVLSVALHHQQPLIQSCQHVVFSLASFFLNFYWPLNKKCYRNIFYNYK